MLPDLDDIPAERFERIRRTQKPPRQSDRNPRRGRDAIEPTDAPARLARQIQDLAVSRGLRVEIQPSLSTTTVYLRVYRREWIRLNARIADHGTTKQDGFVTFMCNDPRAVAELVRMVKGA